LSIAKWDAAQRVLDPDGHDVEVVNKTGQID